MGVCSHWRVLWAVSPLILSGSLNGCATNYQATDLQTVVRDSEGDTGQKISDREFIPAGFGSMKQEDLALHITNNGVIVRAITMDEAVIRVLLPDSYRSLHDLKASYAKRISDTGRRYGASSVSVWYVSFFGVEPEARFAPQDLTISLNGRDFRPYDYIPLTTGFGDQRVKQRETHSAIYIYDGDVRVSQPLSVSYQGMRTDGWDKILQQIDREKAVILARASKSTP